MSAAAQLTMIGTPIMVVVCVIAWIQTRAWRKPARTPRQAQLRAVWCETFPFPQLGVAIRRDGFVYAGATGRCLGLAAGATAKAAASVPVTSVKPATGWAVITFADGTRHRHLIATRNLPQATAQAARFTVQCQTGAAAGFRRTWTPPAVSTP
jgi:hypothetical protein